MKWALRTVIIFNKIASNKWELHGMNSHKLCKIGLQGVNKLEKRKSIHASDAKYLGNIILKWLFRMLRMRLERSWCFFPPVLLVIHSSVVYITMGTLAPFLQGSKITRHYESFQLTIYILRFFPASLKAYISSLVLGFQHPFGNT